MKPVVIKRVEWLGGNEIRAFFATGLVLETKLPWCRVARRTTVIDFGTGLKFGPHPGDEVSARGVAQLPGIVLRGKRPKPMSR